MDKYEYRIKSEEIENLITKGKYAEAVEIADTIDWRRVKSVMMLCKVSDLYKINRRFEDSVELLLLAYDRHPGGRSIVYSLCELAIRMGDLVQAVEYYKEFVQVAPMDSGKYILRYKLYEAQDVSLEERIAVLEEFKAVDYVSYTEKWAYELAYLYHRVGLATRCVEECDELILCCGVGKYVLKAMELKMLHEPLTPEQQMKYDIEKGIRRSGIVDTQQELERREADVMDAPTTEIPSGDLDIEVKMVGVNQYDTINIQKELAENMKNLWEPSEEDTRIMPDIDEFAQEQQASGEPVAQEPAAEEAVVEEAPVEEPPKETKVEEVFFGETVDMDEATRQVVDALQEESAAEEEPRNDLQKTYEKILGMEFDGQISFLMPETEQIEKQITGQIRLDEVLLEWEKVKKDNEEKRKEAVRQRVLEQTGTMFTEFEASIRDGLLEKLESDQVAEEPQMEVAAEEITEEPQESETEIFAQEELVEEIQETEAEVSAEEESEEEIQEVEAEISAEEVPEEEIQEIEPEASAEEQPEEEIQETEPEASAEEQPEEEIQEVEAEIPAEKEPKEEIQQAEAQVPAEEPVAVAEEKKTVREFSPEEEELFGAYAHSESVKEQIIHAIDKTSMASYTGNVIITGNESTDPMTLARNMVKEIKSLDKNFSGKIAKISSESLNRKDLMQTLDQMWNGALIIQRAAGMESSVAEKLYKALNQEGKGIIVLLVDTKKAMNRFLRENEKFEQIFNIRVDIEAPSNDVLVKFGKNYAREKEYSIDELGVLALHTKIADRQTSDHSVTIGEVQEIVDEAIRHANRKNLKHFFDILVARRYDEEDMIILREKDFV
ncbi:MAG: hypothetical protein E7293_08440 [Lachnospiraceae bacterium]|nr:hypothetical protein [Lachnospiraceae bacterium]